MRSRDPLAHPEVLIRRVYAYVAYRIGHGHDAEDVTSATIERALRYRASFDSSKGEPVSWAIGIARTCLDDHLTAQRPTLALREEAASEDMATTVVRHLSVAAAIETLDQRDRELVALRYGADLRAREIGGLLGMTTNAVEVALHRCRERLRRELGETPASGASPQPAITHSAQVGNA